MATEVAAARRRIIRRPRLTSILDESTARIRLLVAPAGYGKTTLAREWLGEEARRGVWYRGGPATADVAALAAGIAEGTGEIVPDAGKRMRERLRATGHPEEDVEILAELFAEDVQEWPADAWLAFDDYQFAMESAASERFVDLLTQQTPIQMLITSRRRPSWATARRILYGEIVEIDRRALAMEDDEARKVLGREDRFTSELIARAGGWPAVLGLASLTDELEVPDRSLPNALYDYFAEELYQGASPVMQRGLGRLAVLPVLTPDLARELLGGSATATLNEALRIGALAKTGPDLELHPLLREFLIAKFCERGSVEVHPFAEDAVRILAAQKHWDGAFDVIVRMSAPHLLVGLVRAALEDLLRNGRTQTISQWLEYAASHHIASPIIDLAESEIAFRQGNHVRAEALAVHASKGLDSPDLRGKALVRAAQAALLDSRDDQALQSFRAARATAKTDPTRLEALVGECFALIELGLGSQAEGLLAEVSHRTDTNIEMRVRQAIVQLVWAGRFGNTSSALEVAAEARPLLDDVKDPLVVTSFLHAYAHLLALSGRYQEASELSQTELETSERYRLQFVLPHALLVDAIAHSGMRDFTKASQQIDAAEDIDRERSNAHIAMHVAALRARIAIARGDFPSAIDHVTRTWQRPSSPAMLAEYLAYRCLASACMGDELATEATAKRLRAMSGLEALILTKCAEAIIAVSMSRSDAAVRASDAFSTARDLGVFDGFVIAIRGFPSLLNAVILQSEEYGPLVEKVLTRSNDFKLARSVGLSLTGSPAGAAGKLTPREQEVARLVAQGHTNRAIGTRLFISESTVKVHVRHILEKLDARSRAELAARISAMD